VEAQAARPSATAFFEELREAWQQAAENAGGIATRRYRIGGHALELRFAGEALVPPLTRALAHLEAPEPGMRPLVVHAWESETTGTVMPRPPWTNHDYLEHGKIRGFFDERFQSVFQWGSHSLVMVDLERGEAIYLVGAASQIPYFEMAAPLRLVLHPWLGRQGSELVHAAAVGTAGRCALLVGKTGSGKSWTTLASIRAGLAMLADDYCVLDAGTPASIASIYSAGKTHADGLERFPFLDELVGNPVRPDDDKAVYFMAENDPGRLLLEAELGAIVIPRRTGSGAARLHPAPAAAALAALAPSTILQLPAAGEKTLRRLGEVVQQVPSLYLDLGTDGETVGPTIAALLDGGG
jgi:hypothetical protein